MTFWEPKHVKINRFEVYWHSSVTRSAEFSEITLDDVEWIEDKTEPADESLAKYGIYGERAPALVALGLPPYRYNLRQGESIPQVAFQNIHFKAG
jgi:hypothetical protein